MTLPKNFPTYRPPPGSNEYAYWRMTLSMQKDPEGLSPLGSESVDHIFDAVGHLQHPPHLDSNPAFHQIRKELMFRHLKWCAIWYRDAVELSSTRFERDQISRLNNIRKAAKALDKLLSDDMGRFKSRAVPLSDGSVRVPVKHLIEATERELAHRSKLGSEPGPERAYRDEFRKCSAFEWFIGNHLPLVFRQIFCRAPGISRDSNQQPDGPFIRFAEKVLEELKITNGGAPYSREAIARALTTARKGQSRRKPPER
jgi:hypothetical protein